jgi:predicted nucleic acid-binding Zn finger protein
MSDPLPAEEASLWEKLLEAHELTPALRDEIIRLFGERGRTALLAVEEGQVKKYLDFFVVVGRSDEYVVEEEFCTCRAQLFRGFCWHVLAARIAGITKKFEEIDEWYLDTWKG